MDGPSRYISLRSVMARYDKSYVQVKYAVETGRLIAEKSEGGWAWMFPVDKLPEEWPEAPRKEKRKKGAIINEQ